jgi:hypothetical protein
MYAAGKQNICWLLGSIGNVTSKVDAFFAEWPKQHLFQMSFGSTLFEYPMLMLNFVTLANAHPW